MDCDRPRFWLTPARPAGAVPAPCGRLRRWRRWWWRGWWRRCRHHRHGQWQGDLRTRAVFCANVNLGTELCRHSRTTDTRRRDRRADPVRAANARSRRPPPTQWQLLVRRRPRTPACSGARQGAVSDDDSGRRLQHPCARTTPTATRCTCWTARSFNTGSSTRRRTCSPVRAAGSAAATPAIAPRGAVRDPRHA